MKLRKIFNLIRKPHKISAKIKKRKLLKNIDSLVHVGANRGQERKLYAKYNLEVLWIEPIEEVFEQLLANTKQYKKQKAIQALITDIDDKEYSFNIANNNGASSSILDLKEHKEIWPHVHFERTISLKSLTLSSLYKRENIKPEKYQALIMDTQGSEILVLKGGMPLLKHFEFIMTEVADFESYKDCCQLADMNEFMTNAGFEEHSRSQFGKPTKEGGRYFNIIYTRINR